MLKPKVSSEDISLIVTQYVHISHLLFSDDILLFSTDDLSSLKNLRLILMVFEKASGLKINLQKSTLTGINVDPNSVEVGASIWGCPTTMLPFDYMGTPLGGNPRSPIINSIERKFDSWKYSYLSKGEDLLSSKQCFQ